MERSPEILNLFGVPIWNPPYEAFWAWFEEALRFDPPRPVLLGIANAHTLNVAYEDPSYRSCLQGFDRVVNDGAGIAMAAAMQGQEIPFNLNGTDLFPKLFAEWPETAPPLKLFLYGAHELSNRGAAEAIEARFPRVRVVGCVHGFVDPEREALPQIRASGADLLLVALGQPRQEIFLATHRGELDVRLACGVGALFDFLSGRVPRAPGWMRKARMEWVYRLIREPRRMFARYVIGNPKFLRRARRWAESLARESAS